MNSRMQTCMWCVILAIALPALAIMLVPDPNYGRFLLWVSVVIVIGIGAGVSCAGGDKLSKVNLRRGIRRLALVFMIAAPVVVVPPTCLKCSVSYKEICERGRALDEAILNQAPWKDGPPFETSASWGAGYVARAHWIIREHLQYYNRIARDQPLTESEAEQCKKLSVC